MNLLFLGGTKFLGRHLVENALQAGHRPTLFHRGVTGAALFPDVEHIHGDRDGGLGALGGRSFDAVIDTSGYLPRLVGEAASRLAGAAERYVFVSTISVYRDFRESGMSEIAPVGTLPDRSVETVDGDTYGPLKALCEVAAERAMPGRVLILRPGLIVGPNDPTNRFTYWTTRLARGGRFLAPLPRERPVQFIDARDLAAWTVRMTEAGTTGVFNVTGPAALLTMEGFLALACDAVGNDARPVWVDEAFLIAEKVDPWMELPLWLPGEAWRGLCEVSVRRALEAGLVLRDPAETVRDTCAWARSLGEALPGEAGLDPEREAALLRAWETRGG